MFESCQYLEQFQSYDQKKASNSEDLLEQINKMATKLLNFEILMSHISENDIEYPEKYCTF